MGVIRNGAGGAVAHHLERLFGRGSLTGLSEGQLLDRFVTSRDESAFEALMGRHGPMVLGVCRQFLRDPNDVDDAFQATFLVLVRKAGSLRNQHLLGNWLYGVACRVALRARSTAARRRAKTMLVANIESECQSSERQADGAEPIPDALLRAEERAALLEEVHRLPGKYRIPVVLCHLEGLTHEEAAAQLGWPLGTVKGRLSRARDLLRSRLTRRGLTVSSAALPAALTCTELNAAVPASLSHSTLQAVLALVAGGGITLSALPAVSLSVASLTEGVLKAMILSQAKSLVIPLLVAGSVVTTGVGVAAYQTSRDGPQTQPSPAPSPSLAVMKKQSGQPNPLASRLPERVEAVKAILGDFEKRMAAGEWNDPEAYDNWSLRLFQLERSTAPQDSSAPYEGHAERMRKMLRTAEALRNAGRLTSLDVSRWDYFSMEAGQMLESQKGDIANVAGAQSVPGLISSSRGQGTIGSARAGPAPPDQPEGNPPPGQPPKQWVAGHAPIGHRGLDDTFGAEDAPDNSGDYIKIIRMAAAVAKWDKNPNTQAVLKRLDQPMTLRFPQETPLEDILKFIKQAIQTPNGSEIAIYVDPLGLQEADKTLSSPIQIDLDGVPLRFSLRLMLKQLGMAYCVHDGVLIISSVDGIKKELEEAQAELEELNRPSSPGGGLQ